jgi:hypothetical protein
MRTARTLVATGRLPRSGLSVEHALIAKVHAALMDAPRPPGVARGAVDHVVEVRNNRVVESAWNCLRDRNASTVALVTPSEAFVATSLTRAMLILEEQPLDPILLLPLGHWAEQVMSGD